MEKPGVHGMYTTFLSNIYFIELTMNQLLLNLSIIKPNGSLYRYPLDI